jgi:hypothetical protein
MEILGWAVELKGEFGKEATAENCPHLITEEELQGSHSQSLGMERKMAAAAATTSAAWGWLDDSSEGEQTV